jgi:hypothetical protein
LKAQQTITQNTRPKTLKKSNNNVIAFVPILRIVLLVFYFLFLNNNKPSMASEEGNPAVYLADWRTSEAKKVLKQMIQDRQVTEAHAPPAVYKMNDIWSYS